MVHVSKIDNFQTGMSTSIRSRANKPLIDITVRSRGKIEREKNELPKYG